MGLDDVEVQARATLELGEGHHSETQTPEEFIRQLPPLMDDHSTNTHPEVRIKGTLGEGGIIIHSHVLPFGVGWPRLILVAIVFVMGATLPFDAHGENEAEQSSASITPFFEARFPSVDQSDALLQDYGFEPVGRRLLPTYGLRAKFWLSNGWRLGGAMAYGFALSEGDVSDVPTTTSFLSMTFSTERHINHGIALGVDTGFALIQHTVGSTEQGGGLLYPGPMLHPKAYWSTSFGNLLVEPSIGYLIQFPLGAAHDNPLWEASFQRSIIHGFVVSIHLGSKL